MVELKQMKVFAEAPPVPGSRRPAASISFSQMMDRAQEGKLRELERESGRREESSEETDTPTSEAPTNAKKDPEEHSGGDRARRPEQQDESGATTVEEEASEADVNEEEVAGLTTAAFVPFVPSGADRPRKLNRSGGSDGTRRGRIG